MHFLFTKNSANYIPNFSDQPGDVIKGCKVILDILTQTGVAEGKNIPMRVALGSDSSPFIRNKCTETIALLDEWDAITTKTNHDDVA